MFTITLGLFLFFSEVYLLKQFWVEDYSINQNVYMTIVMCSYESLQTMTRNCYSQSHGLAVLAFFNVMMEEARSPVQRWLHLGQTCLMLRYLITMLCRMEAYGVTPIPAPINTACSAWNMCVEKVPSK